MNMNKMVYFDSDDIEKAAPYDKWVGTMEDALLTSVSGGYLMPKRMHLDKGNDTFLLMPCVTDKYWATKLVSFCPGNRNSGLPSIYGTVILNSSVTGEPLAVMDGSKITAMRTAAVSSAGIKILSPEGCKSLGIIGAGVQGVSQAVFACSVRKIVEIRVFDKSMHNIRLFSDELHKRYPEIRIIEARDSGEVALNSEIIITATNSQSPVFPDEKQLFTDKTFVGIGSYKPDCREFPEQLFRQLDEIFVDAEDGKKESGDLITPVMSKWIKEDKIFHIGKVISTAMVPSENNTRLFKTVGSAIFDLYAAKLIYESYLKKNA